MAVFQSFDAVGVGSAADTNDEFVVGQVVALFLARGSNGVETAAALRQRWNIPSLFVSGNLDEKTRAMALEWKPIGFVGKPYSEREVLAAIASATKATV